MSVNDPLHSQALVDAASRSGVYHLLAQLWIKELDTDLLNALRLNRLGQAYHDAGGLLPSAPSSSETIDDLHLDYCRLFVGPQGHCPPVQSVWQEGRFEGTAAGSLGLIVDRLGIDTPFVAALPHDHIGNILALFGSLLAAVGTGSDAPDTDLRDLSVGLFLEHVAWIPEFARSISGRCNTDFYRGLMSVTTTFLTQETALVHTAPTAS